MLFLLILGIWYCISKVNNFIKKIFKLMDYINYVMLAVYEGKVVYFFLENYLFFISYDVAELFLRKFRIKSSSFYFFSREPDELTLLECMLLGILVNYFPILIVSSKKIGRESKYKCLLKNIYKWIVQKLIIIKNLIIKIIKKFILDK